MNIDGKRVSLFSAKVVCQVIDVLFGNIDYAYDGSTSIVTPAGTDLVLWLPSVGETEALLRDKSKYVYADLISIIGSVGKHDSRVPLVSNSAGVRPSMATRSNDLSAIGQYLGYDGERHLVQSEFLVQFFLEDPCHFSFGEWVEVTGEFMVDWDPWDVIP